MALNVQGVSGTRYEFEGPYNNMDPLENRSGVYVIVCVDEYGNPLVVKDVGETSEVKRRVDGHGREECWNQKCDGNWKVAVLYTPNQQQETRMEIEQDIRDNFTDLCGDQ